MKSTRTIRQDSGWIALTNYQTGYEPLINEDYLFPAYRIIDGICYLRGAVLRTTSPPATSPIAFILDEFSTPYSRINFTGVEETPPSKTLSRSFIRIQSNGQFAIFTTASTNFTISRIISLDAISYPI